MLGWISPSTWRRLAGGCYLLLLPGVAVASLHIAPAAEGPLAPGTVLRVEWNGDGARPGMDEMELILSLDGGSTWPIRLSRDLPIEGRTFEIRLPRLPSAEARIALRAGQEGEPETEAILAISGPLAIEGIEGTQGPSVPTMEPLARVAGEWRTPEAVTPGTPSTPPLDPEIGKNGSFDPSRDLKGADLGDEALLPVLPAPLQDGDFEQTRPRVPSPHLSSRTLLSTPRRE